jgi:VWFA-related protein
MGLLLAFALVCARVPVRAQTSARTTSKPAASSTAAPPPSQLSELPSPQQQARPADNNQNNDDEVVRINSNLVQLDVSVTGGDGRSVADLRPEEFEVIVDGRRQVVTELSYISVEASTTATKRRADRRAAEVPPLLAPPVRLKPEQVRRTIALVVDDLGTSFESMAFVREGLKQFVNEQMLPGDLVAVIRTSAGMGSLQQFTSDKRLLLRAIERVRWTPRGRAGISAFAPVEADPLASARSRSLAGERREESANDYEEAERRAGEEVDEFREDIFAVGTLGALNFIIKGLRDLPGRKSVVMFSDGFQIYRRDGGSDRVRESLRRLIDLATRSSVVINTIDARGLAFTGLSAADNTGNLSPAQVERALFNRRESFFNTQAGLSYLADATGGLFIRNNNDLGDGVRRVLEAQRDYYLVGFRPDESLFDQGRGRVRFNRVEIKVARKGLRVRTRNGFYGFTERDARTAPRTRHEQMLTALTSPFAAGAVPLRLTSLFIGEPPDKTAVVSLLHVDVSGFRFEEEADGWHKAVLDVVALTFGEGGQLIDDVDRTETIRARGDAYRLLLKEGLNISMHVPVKKPGAYQLRVVVRDAATEKIGSASQFIEVPDLKKGRLTLSGIVLSSPDAQPAGAAGGEERKSGGMDAPGKQLTAGGAVGGGSSDGSGVAGGPSGAAVRRFRRGSEFLYLFDIYNAQADKTTGQPSLTTQMRLLHDGKPVYESSIAPFNSAAQTNPRQLRAGGRLRLGLGLQPGEYLLQVIVTDALAKPQHRVATQWIDFEVYE